MNSSLFRKEALEFKKDRLYGEVILLQPLSLTILASIVVVICVMIIAVLAWGTYARKEKVRGFVVPDKGIVKVYAPRAGTLSELYIGDNQVIKQGQPLAMLLSERTLQSGHDVDKLIMQEIQTSNLQAYEQIENEKRLLGFETTRLNNQIKGLQGELSQVNQSLNNQQQRIAISKKRYQNAQQLLSKQHLSQHDFQRVYEELLEQQQQHQNLQRTQINANNNLTQAQSELSELPIKFKTRINEIENTISHQKQRLAEVQGNHQFEIRAPIDGVVTALQGRPGQWRSQNIPLLAILPKDSKFQVELYVPSRAIGFIENGQKVRVRYDAFPYRRYGSHPGIVSLISKDILLPNELPVPLDVREPVYRVVVDLDKQFVTAYGKELSLQAGMSIEADIILQKQTLIDWILDPLLSMRG